MIILGIDPGLNKTGYGVIEVQESNMHVIEAGHIRLPGRKSVVLRLENLYKTLSKIITRHKPQTVVLETVFTHQRYVSTASLMAHARGVVCLAVQENRLPLFEYPPARVKKALTGKGAASKDQVARMVSQWLGAKNEASWSSDATDALALAIAHAHMENQRQLLPTGAFSR